MDAKERAKELLEEKLEETVIETSTLLDNTIKNFRQGNNYNLIKKELSKIGNCIKYVASIYLELFGLEKSELRNWYLENAVFLDRNITPGPLVRVKDLKNKTEFALVKTPKDIGQVQESINYIKKRFETLERDSAQEENNEISVLYTLIFK